VIPRCGYRPEDMLDDVAVPLPGWNPSAEVRMAAIVHAHELADTSDPEIWTSVNVPANGEHAARTTFVQNPSAEVRSRG
jgi:hypothetical protein